MSINLEKNLNDWMENNFPLGINKIAVAVSGGADSLCLTMLLKKWAKEHKVELMAFTINHGLRKEAAKEAEAVHNLLQKKGIKHQTLLWKGTKPKTGIEEKARIARYELLQKACLKEKISYLFLAHHLEDQVETFWSRLAHGSGPDGLSGMSDASVLGQLYLMRPLLKEKKSDLVNYLKKNKLLGTKVIR